MNLKEALAEIERLKVYEQAFAHAWELKTKFDRENRPREIRAVFKVTTISSEHHAGVVHTLLTDFNAFAASIDL